MYCARHAESWAEAMLAPLEMLPIDITEFRYEENPHLLIPSSIGAVSDSCSRHIPVCFGLTSLCNRTYVSWVVLSVSIRPWACSQLFAYRIKLSYI